MKTEYQIAELIFQPFRQDKCEVGKGYFMRTLNHSRNVQLNPKEQELFGIVFDGLQCLGYITVDDDGDFLRLTQKGYDYIYDNELAEKIQAVPWVIPEFQSTNWTKAWNKLWNLIGDKDAPMYYSGPNFLKLICSLDDRVERNYSRYIDKRNQQKLSTSRKDYFRDLIEDLDEKTRYKFYVKIQLSFEYKILGSESQEKEDDKSSSNRIEVGNNVSITNESSDDAKTSSHPKVFISYSWDSEEHKQWVLNFATKLCENGINVILDQWELNKGGAPITHFMQQSVSSSDRVLCILTPNYKTKTDKLKGGVGFEYSILSSDVAIDLTTTKFVPILRDGDPNISVPTLLKSRISYDMRESDNFDDVFNNLLRDLYDEPKIKKPALGNKPNFSNS